MCGGEDSKCTRTKAPTREPNPQECHLQRKETIRALHPHHHPHYAVGFAALPRTSGAALNHPRLFLSASLFPSRQRLPSPHIQTAHASAHAHAHTPGQTAGRAVFACIRVIRVTVLVRFVSLCKYTPLLHFFFFLSSHPPRLARTQPHESCGVRSILSICACHSYA